jgi:hypothetical protein
MEGYWPWWLGALALSAFALGFFALLGRPPGVTSLWRQVLGWRTERALARAEASLPAEAAALEAMLAEATRRAFGALAAPPESTGRHQALPALAPRLPWTAALTFLLMLAAGGALAAWLRGGPRLRLEPDLAGPLGAALGWGALLAGGLLVGLGARMAGGCTSGHGLNGAARLQPGSLAAVACFFAAGGGVAWLLRTLVGGGP